MWDSIHKSFAQRLVRPAAHVHVVSVRVRKHWQYMRALLWMQVTFASRLVFIELAGQNGAGIERV